MTRKRPDPLSSSASQGFTFVEVLVAMAVFSIGILGVAGLQIISVKSNASASTLTLGAMAGENQVERLMGLKYTDAALFAGTHSPSQDNDGVDNNFDGQIDEPGETGPITVSYVVEDHTPVRNTKTITHTIVHPHVFGDKTISFVQVIPET
ncbi:prepilin-type N-terminal cleavage/methylation domain-containing protein [Desulfosarcina sp. OttesenSCG-928-G10]|nr:prepilin-type N-terminal cleavage/methylation domain-containing protein [Desulfosarcina sp. OttesenSCG-928-G10]MDL2322039.1 prepilin-type N-terminal cleavage/methylation domain-containing protein [Desulfosarcina sp. OttesenSCG-928-B08]